MAQNKKKSTKVAERDRMRQAAREEAERLKAAQAAKDRRRKLVWTGVAVLVVVFAVVVVLLVLQNTKGEGFDTITKPQGATKDGAIVIGQDLQPGGEPATGDDVVVVRVYSDYICPYCGQTERRIASRLEEMAAAGEIKLELQPVAALDGYSDPPGYSTRAENAAMTVAALAPEQFLAYHNKLFEADIQPAEGSEGLTDERLAELALEVGVPQDVVDQFAEGKLAQWGEYTTVHMADRGVQVTPTILMGKSDSSLKPVANPVNINLDEAVANVRAGNDPN
jgi:protein-disulfide isomerase